MSESKQFSVSLSSVDGYKFEVDFGEAGTLITDEPAPLGHGEGPNPSLLLGTSVANCLAASLMFAIRKFKEEPGQVSAKVTGHFERIDRRLRITGMEVSLNLGNLAESFTHLDRVLEQFEEFCVVTQSVKAGIPTQVKVFDSAGKLLKGE